MAVLLAMALPSRLAALSATVQPSSVVVPKMLLQMAPPDWPAVFCSKAHCSMTTSPNQRSQQSVPSLKNAPPCSVAVLFLKTHSVRTGLLRKFPIAPPSVAVLPENVQRRKIGWSGCPVSQQA